MPALHWGRTRDLPRTGPSPCIPLPFLALTGKKEEDSGGYPQTPIKGAAPLWTPPIIDFWDGLFLERGEEGSGGLPPYPHQKGRTPLDSPDYRLLGQALSGEGGRGLWGAAPVSPPKGLSPSGVPRFSTSETGSVPRKRRMSS